MFKIVKNVAPAYLCNRITFHRQLHNYNTRRKNDIVTPFARSRTKMLSFFIDTAARFNDISQTINTLDISIIFF